jgi:hypothetical protein
LLDVDVTGEEFLEGLSHEQIRQRTEDITNNWVFFIGEATSYLGYTNNDAEPALNYHIVDTVENLEAVPIDPDSPVADYPDYERIMNDHNICDLVDNQGVDEVLIWAYQGFPVTRLAISESKMSSSQFGDVSNSPRFDDMPHCNNTYIVYTFNYARGTPEAIHAWGHQIEVELSEVDPELFRDRWQGPNYPQTLDVDGRCGSVHNAPNARFEYDTINPEPHRSDCLDWDPDGIGELSDISCANWGCVENSDVDNPSLNYHVWNWQNLPGINNDKEYQGEQLRNWWDVHGDFDNVMANSRSLTVN